MMEYPNLPYRAATAFNQDLYRGEAECAAAFVKRYRVFIPIWEYGYYFLTEYLDNALVQSHNALPAGLFSEGHAALRASFLVACQGYQPDAAALLRRAHESFIRAVACGANPAKALTIVRSSDISRAERDLKLDFSRLYSLESGFAHSNRLRSLDTMIAIRESKTPPSEYGPHAQTKLHDLLSKVAVFWLYFGTKVAPVVVAPGRRHHKWLALQADSAGLLLGYLRDSKSGLVGQCAQVDAMVESLELPAS